MRSDTVDSLEDEEDGWSPEPWNLARAGAITNLANALEAKNLGPEAAKALARAATRPDDMRRKLADPAELRVQGGTLLVVETRLWSASVLPHTANPREYGHRTYALGGAAGLSSDVLLEPESALDGRAELTLKVAEPEALVARLTDAEMRLIHENRLIEDVSVEGILQPLTVVPLTISHTNEHSPVTILIAADGSSRISSVHHILGYSVANLVYEFAADDRKFRQSVSSLIRLPQTQGWDTLSESERARLRVLTLPARVVIGFRPEARSNLAFHTAIRNLIGLTHIRPPKAYGSAVENEAKADAVLDALARPLRTRPALIGERKKQWLAGTISPDQAFNWGFPQHPDARVSEIVRTVLSGGNATARRVNDGIRTLTVKQQPKREDRVDIAVELILRTLRTKMHDDPKYIRPRRAVLQRVYRLPEIAELPGGQATRRIDSTVSLDQLRDQALEEIAAGYGDNGRLAPAQTELAIKSAYYMAASEPMALQRELFGGTGEEDDRSAATVVRAMLSRRRGVLQAYRIVRAGRQEEPLFEVDENDEIVHTSGHARILTNSVVRHTYNGENIREVDAGASAASRQWGLIETTVEKLKKSIDEMKSIPIYSGGPSLIERDGWESNVVSVVRKKLDVIDRRLADWADRHDDRAPSNDDRDQAADGDYQ